MQIGILDLDVRTVSPCLTGARAAEQAGFDTYWLSGGWRDPVTLATAAGCAVPRIEIGTAIVSVWGMHPLAMAEQALTVNDALGGRFVLGLGISHPHMVRERFGRTYERPVRFLREFLTILMTAMDRGKVEFDGDMLSCHTELRLQNMRRPKVLIAALGPQSVAVAGRWADGTKPGAPGRSFWRRRRSASHAMRLRHVRTSASSSSATAMATIRPTRLRWIVPASAADLARWHLSARRNRLLANWRATAISA